MEDVFYFVRKSSFLAGWICGGLSIVIPVLAIESGFKEFIGPSLVIGGLFGIATNVIGATHNSKVLAYLGIAGFVFALILSRFIFKVGS